jgi:CubicO group peptidase (beta-lactamase class C family)
MAALLAAPACGQRSDLGELPLSVAEATSLAPATPAGRALTRFLLAFNTGSFSTLQDFISENPGFQTSGPGRFVQAFREYGPVDLLWIEPSEEPGAGAGLRVSAWTRGRQTRAALGFLVQVQADRPDCIDWIGIDRRDRPPEPMRMAPLADDDQLGQELSRWAEANRGGPFSGVVALGRDGDVLIEVALGEREPGGVAIRTGDAFLLASVSKIFVGLATARLVAEGKLGWDGHISPLLSEFPAPRIESLTLAHLLTHRSGLEFDEDPDFVRELRAAQSVQAMVALQAQALRRLPEDRLFRPLPEPDYSNEGFVAAARIVEVASGLPYDRYLQEVVAEGLGLEQTLVFRKDALPLGFAEPWTGRRLSDGAAIPGPLQLALPQGYGSPAGGLVSCTRDLLAVGRAIQQRTWLPGEVWDEVFAQGFGFDVERDEAGQLVRIGHDGNSFGVSAEFWIHHRTGHVLVVLANREGVGKAVASYFNEIIPR